MKRSCSAPSLTNKEKVKKVKEEPNSREYLQLALAKVLELQRAVRDDSYFDNNTSDLEESDTEEEVMKKVLTKVFKDLPGSSSTITSAISRAIHPTPREYSRIRAKSIQLSGYDTCRKVAVDFMKNIVKYTPKYEKSTSENEEIIQEIHHTNKRRGTVSTEYELRSRMLKSLDLHLAAKQRDYTLKLMRL
ncbi:uncharacterized protein [Chelonus insularis]|uniref:uncharacterized protein n=1 Tax=Chelonus insularis TaxID=460826 RepID=UPI00158C26FA|nr:uncharacterized protein LOC118072143 [Chelonus insularis]